MPIKQGIAKRVVKQERKIWKKVILFLLLCYLFLHKTLPELWKVIFAALSIITMMLTLVWTKNALQKLYHGLTRNIGL